MSSEGDQPAALVVDANVLIDYAESDCAVLPLISFHLAPLRVPSPVFAEVRQLELSDAESLAIGVLEPTLRQAMEAQFARAAPSFQDQLCLIVARDTGAAVLTNDTALRRACDEAGIPCVWGIEAMGVLVKDGYLSPVRAVRVAERIARGNPFITPDIVARFRRSVGL